MKSEIRWGTVKLKQLGYTVNYQVLEEKKFITDIFKLILPPYEVVF